MMEKTYIRPAMEVLAIAAELPVAATQMRKDGSNAITDSGSILGKQRTNVDDEGAANDGWNGWL